MSACFNDICESNDVTFDVGMRINKAVADASLRGQMNYAIKFMGVETALYRHPIGEVCPDERIVASHSLCGFFEDGKSRLFDQGVVIVIDYVEPNNTVATLQQALGGMKAYKTGVSRHEYFQCVPNK